MTDNSWNRTTNVSGSGLVQLDVFREGSKNEERKARRSGTRERGRAEGRVMEGWCCKAVGRGGKGKGEEGRERRRERSKKDGMEVLEVKRVRHGEG